MVSDSQPEDQKLQPQEDQHTLQGSKPTKTFRLDMGVNTHEHHQPHFINNNISQHQEKALVNQLKHEEEKAAKKIDSKPIFRKRKQRAEIEQQSEPTPYLQKMKLFQELNHFLDELSTRITDLESRELYISHSLLLLDHERRQFRLWKTLEIQSLEDHKREWHQSNYGLPPAKVESELSPHDQIVIQELRAIATLSETADTPENVATTDIHEPINIQPERIYVLDLEPAEPGEDKSDPSIPLPDLSVIHGEVVLSTNQFAELSYNSTFEKTTAVANPHFETRVEIDYTTEPKNNSVLLEVPELISHSTKDVEKSASVITETIVNEKTNPTVDEPLNLAQELGRSEFLIEQQNWEALREQQIEDLERRQKLSLKQIRFQKEHLEKLRREFESDRNVSLYEYQQMQTQLALSRQILDQQQHQLRQARELLDERSESCLREEAILRELQSLARAQHQQAEAEVDYIYSLETQLRETLQTQEAEFRRQENQLKQLLEEIVPKQTQLTTMRNEIEKVHRETLQIREALDLAWRHVKGDAQFVELEHAFKRQQLSLNDMMESKYGTMIRHHESASKADEQTLIQLEDYLRLNLEVLEAIRMQLPQLIPPVSQLITGTFEGHEKERQAWLEEKLEAERIIHQLVDQLEYRISISQDHLTGDSFQSEAA